MATGCGGTDKTHFDRSTTENIVAKEFNEKKISLEIIFHAIRYGAIKMIANKLSSGVHGIEIESRLTHVHFVACSFVDSSFPFAKMKVHSKYNQNVKMDF